MKHNVGTLLGVVGVTTAATLLGVGEAQAVLLIDDFLTNQLVTAPNQETVQADPSSTIFGGFRGVDLSNAASGTDSQGNLVFDQVSIDQGAFVFDTTASISGQSRTARLVYAGDQGDSTSVGDPAASSVLPAVDFLNQGAGIKFGNASGQIENLTVNLFNSGTGTATSSLSFTSQATPEDIFLSFGSFTKVSGSGSGTVTDILSQVKGVEVIVNSIDSSTNSRFEKIEVTAVPFEAETSAALLLLGSWGAWKYFKKRNQQKVQLTASDEN